MSAADGTDAAGVMATYYEAWRTKDFEQLRSVLADDMTFRGPLGTADDAESCLRGLRGMSEIVTDIVVEKVFVDGPDVLTWFELHTSVAPPATTASWGHVEGGKVTRLQATFDARALAPPG